MIDTEFLRDFFGTVPHPWRGGLEASYGREVVQKALELSKGQSPETNLMPYIQIVLDAKRLGLTVTR
jgi:hypothetical protein